MWRHWPRAWKPMTWDLRLWFSTFCLWRWSSNFELSWRLFVAGAWSGKSFTNLTCDALQALQIHRNDRLCFRARSPWNQNCLSRSSNLITRRKEQEVGTPINHWIYSLTNPRSTPAEPESERNMQSERKRRQFLPCSNDFRAATKRKFCPHEA